MSSTYTLRVRYAETDQMGFAHHANHLIWFEAARTEFLRTTACSYADFERAGIFIPVLEASCRYLGPAFYDDVLEVECRAGELTPARLELRYQIRRGEVRLAEGRTVHAFMGTDRRPVNLRKRAPELWAILQSLA